MIRMRVSDDNNIDPALFIDLSDLSLTDSSVDQNSFFASKEVSVTIREKAPAISLDKIEIRGKLMNVIYFFKSYTHAKPNPSRFGK
jgi:hypothetical protein